MKIALVTPISLRSFGGAERKLVEAADMLAEKKYDASLYAPPYTHPMSKVKKNSIFPSDSIDAKYYEAKHHKIQANVAYVVYAPLIWRRFKISCPIIAGLHSPLLFVSKSSLTTFTNPLLAIQRYKSLKYMASFWLSRFIKPIDLTRFHAVRILNSALDIKHRHVYCIPDWVNSKVFRPRITSKKDVFTVFFSGRHHWEKGFDIFLKLATILKERGVKMRFICTREGMGFVEGTGFLDDNKLAEAYSSSHLVVYPSRMDTFGGVNLEAAACGTPVITTPIPAHQLGLPLLYADKLSDYIRATLTIYDMWKQQTGQYEKLARAQYEQALKYDIKKIFPKFELMLKQVAELDKI
jgi:glycosyltransferase involved in cell wall biosynthesis